MQALPLPRDDGAPDEGEAVRQLHGREDADQTFLDAVLACDLPGHLVLAPDGLVQVDPLPARTLSDCLGVGSDRLGSLAHVGAEVGHADALAMEEVPEGAVVPERHEVSADDQAIDRREGAEDLVLMCLLERGLHRAGASGAGTHLLSQQAAPCLGGGSGVWLRPEVALPKSYAKLALDPSRPLQWAGLPCAGRCASAPHPSVGKGRAGGQLQARGG